MNQPPQPPFADRLAQRWRRTRDWLTAKGLGRFVPESPPSGRRLTEAGVLLAFIVVGGAVYRAGPERATPQRKDAAEARDWVMAFQNREWPPNRLAGLATRPERGSALVLMDQLGGETHAQARDGRYLFFGRGRRLVGYDLNPARWPAGIGTSRLLDAAPTAIDVRSGYAYLALFGDTRLHVLGVPDARTAEVDEAVRLPTRTFVDLGTVDLEGWPRAIASDNAAPGDHPRLYVVEKRDLSEGRGNIVVGTPYLTVLDIADGRAPRILASSPLPFEVAALAVPPGDPRTLYLAVPSDGSRTAPSDDSSRRAGIAVMDVSEAAEPRLAGFVEGVDSAHAISIGHYAYVIGQPAEFDRPIDDGVMQLDLGDPRMPRRTDLDFSEMPEAAARFSWNPNRLPRFGAFFADTDSFEAPSFGLAVSGGRLAAMLAGGLGSPARQDVLVDLSSLEVYGARLYAISEVGGNGPAMWNLQTPYRELMLALGESIETGDPPASLAVDRDLLIGGTANREKLQRLSIGTLGHVEFLPRGIEPADLAGGRRVLSSSLIGLEDDRPGRPYRYRGNQPPPPPEPASQGPPRVAVEGDYGVTLRTEPVLAEEPPTVVGKVEIFDMYPGNAAGGRILADVTLTAPGRPESPANPGRGKVAATWDVALESQFAYVVTQDSLRIIDILKAEEVGRLGGLGAAGAIVVTGGHAYVADRGAGLRVIDVTRPASPRLVATLPPAGAIGVAAFDGGLAVLDETGGLSLFRIDRPGKLAPASRIEARDINTPDNLATRVAAAGHSVFLAGPGFVWATSTDAPEASAYFENNDFLGAIQAIAAVDGLLYVSDRRSGVLVFDHVTAPYWAQIAPTVHEPPELGAAVATTTAQRNGEDDSGPITSFKVGAEDEGHTYGTIGVWLDGPADALAQLGRTVFLEPVDLTRDERVFRFAGRRRMVLPPGVEPVAGSDDDVDLEAEVHWDPNPGEWDAFATEFAAPISTRTAIPGLPRPSPTVPLPPIVAPDFSTLHERQPAP